jgi:hypothetical protein
MPETSRRRKWLRILLIALVILAILGGAYAYWGHALNRRYEALVDELHGMGVPTWAELTREPVPEEKNGWSRIAEAEGLRDEISEAMFDELEGDETLYLLSSSMEDSDWTPEARAFWRSVSARVERCIALAEEAACREVLAPPPGDDPSGNAEFGSLIQVVNVLMTQVSFDRSAATRIAPLLLELASSWKATGNDRWIGHHVLRGSALKLLREGIASGDLDPVPIRDRVESTLVVWDPVGEADRCRRLDAMNLIWLVDEYRSGRDPLAGPLETLGEIKELTEGTEAEETLDAVPTPRTGWMASWIARPLMLRSAVGALEAVRAGLEEELTPERMRDSRDFTQRWALMNLAAVRLARLTFRIVAFREANGRLPADLSDPALTIPDDLRRDPISGGPFRFVAAEGSVTLSSALPSWLKGADDPEARRESLRGANLIWTIPAE